MTKAQAYLNTLEPGDSVTILDTSNNREREGVVRRLKGKPSKRTGVQVYVIRFNSLFDLDKDGLTNLGRFRLVVP